MFGCINGYNFGEMEAMKYYAMPSTWDEAKKRENVQSKIFSGDWMATEKMDGFFGKFVKDDAGNMMLYSRNRGVNGQFADKLDWVPQLRPFFNSLPEGTCLLGELYLPSSPGSKNVQTILGCLQEKAIARQEKGEKICFYVFDCLAMSGRNLMDKGYEERAAALVSFFDTIQPSKYVRCGKWFSGAELWEELGRVLDAGGEGMVIMKKTGKYEPSKRPSSTTLKIKKEIKQTIDCFFTGAVLPPTREYTGKDIEHWKYWMDGRSGQKLTGELYPEMKAGRNLIPITKGYFHDWAGSLQIGVLRKTPGGKTTIMGVEYPGYHVESIGWLSGLPDEIKAHPQQYAFKRLEVSAMEIYTDGASITLRHGKMVQWRPDLNLKDCLWQKI